MHEYPYKSFGAIKKTKILRSSLCYGFWSLTATMNIYNIDN